MKYGRYFSLNLLIQVSFETMQCSDIETNLTYSYRRPVSGNRDQINREKVLVLCLLITVIIIHLFFSFANRASTVYIIEFTFNINFKKLLLRSELKSMFPNYQKYV